MDRIKRKKPEFRRIAAMIMAAAMIISVIPFPEGLFHVTAAAAVKMSATWTAANSTLTDSDDAEAASVKGGKLTNDTGDTIQILGTATFTKRDSDFLANNGVSLDIPVVEGAKTCTLTIVSYSDITESNANPVLVSGMENVKITRTGTGDWSTYTITGTPDKNVSAVTLTMQKQEYFRSVQADSSTSLAVTSASFADGGDTTAEWTNSNGSVLASNSTSSIQKTTGTYTNTDGDVLYVDASTGKFAPSGSYIQINNTTKMTVPVIGDKAVLTAVVYKGGTGTDISEVLDGTHLNLTGTGLLKAECISNVTAPEDANSRKVEIVCYLDGQEGELTLEVLTNTYFKSLAISCETLDKAVIKGSVTATGSIPDGTAIVATNQTTGLSYTGTITNGTYAIEIPAESEEMTYELSVSDPEYQIASGVTTHTVSNASLSDITANLKLVKLSTCVVTGSISGFADDYDISSLDVLFKAAGETEYVPEVTVDTKNKTYTAKLEKDMPYSVALQGVNDYELTAPAENVTYSEDSTLNMTVALKPTYQVSLTLPDTPDLSGKNITYTYVNQDDGYTYIFSNKEAISLRDGTYLLQLSGDFLAQPYCVKSGLYVTVAGKKAAQTLTFEEVTSWSFAYSDDGNYYQQSINGTTGYYNGLYVDAATGKLVPNGSTPNSAQFTTGAKISVPVSGKCTISVEAYQPQYALYTIGGTAADTTTAVSTYTYDSGEAGTVEIVSTGGAYLSKISVVYAAKDVEYVEQPEMPKTYDYGTADSLVVQPTGQRLVVTQTGGTLTGKESISDSVSYFGFDETADINRLTADVTILECGTSSSNGVFFGAFNKNGIATAGIRKGTELKMIYSKSSSEMVGAAGTLTGNVTLGTRVRFELVKTDEGLAISITPKDDKEQQIVYKYSSTMLLQTDRENTAVSYGFVFAGVKAVIQNMKYTAEDGTVRYDQNACYYAQGTAPVVESVTAQQAETRDYITVSWTNSVEADGDGMYVLQVSDDGGKTWENVDTAITDTTYRYKLKNAGDYNFRVCGKLGVSGEYNDFVQTDAITVIAPLSTPAVSISSTADKVKITWAKVYDATAYDVYRYSYDETEENAKKIATTTECAYEDTDVTAEMPYYYYIVANSYIGTTLDNYSNPSETVWAVPSAGHKGDYVYEDDAVGFTITKRSYDTVFDGKITLEGVVEKVADVSLVINGETVDTQSVKAKETFAFDDKEIAQGRNDVELRFTDKDGNITRETFNFVYLTNYQKVVDAAYDGTDGEEVNGIATYKTVQAAVNSVAASNERRVVIFVKEGDYEEHLSVTSPYITLIGEDSEKTRIYYDTKEWVGGDMSQRCAVSIGKAATGFSAENLTIENTYKYLGDGSLSNESCDALRNDAENTLYVNVRILGYQDTLCANAGTQYYYKCYIAGNVDFIYGNEPRAFFNDCKLVFRYSAAKNSGYVCAPKTGADAAYGLTFYKCRVLSETGCSGSRYYLARPWGADAYITWIDCYMGKILRANTANPYTDMSGNPAAGARFFEFGSFGPGYAININRRQISSAKAEEMTTTGYLGWDPYTIVAMIGGRYVGTVNTGIENKFVEKEYVSDTYSGMEGDDTGLDKYVLEGYAQSGKTTGGGLLMESSKDYYTAGSAEEFLQAIQSIKASGRPSVLELTSDIALGTNEVEGFNNYKAFITAHKLAPLTHPTLIQTGVSMLKLQDMSDLTIYSKNGAKITHTCIDITGSSNIIIRNIEFDEIWEWDDETEGAYDRNDWDYMTIEKGSSNIWIDHCTFYKAYDGVIDVKTPADSSNVTISWCEFLPASEDSVFFDTMMNAMKENPDNYPYYKHLLEAGMTDQQIYNYAYGQKKTHLLGQSDTDTSAKNITVTLANNYYKDSMDRMPRLRFGTAHVYNCIMDAQDLRNMRLDIQNTVGSAFSQKIVSNGASSNCGAHMLLENCYMSGMTNALISGNGDSEAGYINAFNTMYLLDSKEQELKITLNTHKEGETALVQDRGEFIESLPYSGYTLYAASDLETQVQPYTGAGKLTMTTLQWEKTAYNDVHKEHTEHTWNDGAIEKEATCTETGVKVYTCTVCGDTKEEEIPATGHVWDEGKVTTEATTEAEGVKTYTCTICGDTKTEAIPKLDDNDNKGDTDDDNNGKTDVSIDVVAGENTPAVAVDGTTDDIVKKVLTQEEQKSAANGAKTAISLHIADITATVSDTEKELIAKKLSDGQSAGMYLDIVLKAAVGESTRVVTDTNEALTMKITVPESLRNTDTSKKRTYDIVRVHGKDAVVLSSEFNQDDMTITFTTGQFSTYAVVYKDTAVIPEQPTTPGQPTTPTQPTTPEQPTIPEQPTTPAQPTTPEQPTTSAQPTTPAQPENPTIQNTESTEKTTAADNAAEETQVQTGDSVSSGKVAGIVIILIASMAVIGFVLFKKKKNDTEE